MRGATWLIVPRPARVDYFNPRTPCGVRRVRLKDVRVYTSISIHAPHAGCDIDMLAAIKTWVEFQSTHPMRGATGFAKVFGADYLISIHAPHAGCDLYMRIRPTFRGNFNPRTPCGVRRQVFRVRQDGRDFNPRTPCGVRPSAVRSLCRRHAFQSTHPMRGATRYARGNQDVGGISIHAPHAGCDLAGSRP